MSEDNNSAPVFRVGQKVVCVDASDDIPGTSIWKADAPIEGEVYTVLKVGASRCDGVPALLLLEIKNTAIWDFSYRASRFRPIVERKTDISIFTAMLNPSRKEATV
jgi:hypothetical protein